MSLHTKSRDLLFKEYINRNYQGSKQAIKRTLLKIKPDEILLLKKNFENLNNLNKKIIPLFENFNASAAQNIEKIILDSIYKTLDLKSIIFYRKNSVKKIFGKGFNASKNKKNNDIPAAIDEQLVLKVFKTVKKDKKAVIIPCYKTKDSALLFDQFSGDSIIYFILIRGEVSGLLVFEKPPLYDIYKNAFETSLKQYLTFLLFIDYFSLKPVSASTVKKKAKLAPKKVTKENKSFLSKKR